MYMMCLCVYVYLSYPQQDNCSTTTRNNSPFYVSLKQYLILKSLILITLKGKVEC